MNEEQATARCWAEIDLDAVEANYDSARRICGPGCRVIPVMKANAYGLGAARLSRALAAKGARLFAVAELNEALELKAACGADALVLGMTAPCQMARAVAEGVVMTVYSLEAARRLDAAAAGVGKPARIHVKLDSGLHRLGFDWDRAMDELPELFAMKRLRVEGMYTHLALREDVADAVQVERLLSVAQGLRGTGMDFGLLHAADSIGMVRHPGYRFDAVRTGAWLYGVVPSRYDNSGGDCQPTLRLMARVAQVRRVSAGEYLGYDESHPLRGDRVIATLSAGYADGYPRLNSVGEVIVRGRRAPVAGLVCMDQMTVDVTGIAGVRPGDPVTLLGGGVGLNACADWADTNRNDLLSRIGRRVPKVYMRHGAVESIACAFE